MEAGGIKLIKQWADNDQYIISFKKLIKMKLKREAFKHILASKPTVFIKIPIILPPTTYPTFEPHLIF